MSNIIVYTKGTEVENGLQVFDPDDVTFFITGIRVPWNDTHERFIPFSSIESINVPNDYHVDIK